MAAVLPPQRSVDIPQAPHLQPNATVPISQTLPAPTSSITSASTPPRPGFFRIVYQSFIGIFIGIFNFYRVITRGLIDFVTRIFLALCGRQQRTAPTPISLSSSTRPGNFTEEEVKGFLREELEWARANPPPPEPAPVARPVAPTGGVEGSAIIQLDPNRFNGISINEAELASVPPPPDIEELRRNIAGQNVELQHLIQEFDFFHGYTADNGYTIVPSSSIGQESVVHDGVEDQDATEKRNQLKSYLGFATARRNRYSYTPEVSRQYFDLLHLYIKNIALIFRKEREKENEQARLRAAGDTRGGDRIQVLSRDLRDTTFDELCRCSQNCDPDITNETERQYLSLKGGFAAGQLDGYFIRNRTLEQIRDLKEDLLGVELYTASQESDHNHAINFLNFIRRTVGKQIGLNTNVVNVNDPLALRNMFLPIRRSTGERHAHPKQLFRELLKVYIPSRIIPALLEKNNRNGSPQVRPFAHYISNLLNNEAEQNRITRAEAEAWYEELIEEDSFSDHYRFKEKGIEFLLVHLKIFTQAPEIPRRIPLIDLTALRPAANPQDPAPTQPVEPSVAAQTLTPANPPPVDQPVVNPPIPPAPPQPPIMVRAVVIPPANPPAAVRPQPIAPLQPVAQPVIPPQPMPQPVQTPAVVVQQVMAPATPLGIVQWNALATQVAVVRTEATTRPLRRLPGEEISRDLSAPVLRGRVVNDDGARHHLALIRTHYLALAAAQRMVFQEQINARAPELFEQQARMFIALDMIIAQPQVFRPRYSREMGVDLDVLRIEYMTLSDQEKAQFVASIYSTVRPASVNVGPLWDAYQQQARLLLGGNPGFVRSVQMAVLNL